VICSLYYSHLKIPFFLKTVTNFFLKYYLILIFATCQIILIIGCKEEVGLPLIETISPVDITRISAIAGGIITYDGGSQVLGRGICWGNSHDPDFTDRFNPEGEGSGMFSSSITGLTPNTLYFVRAYATNKLGTAFGKEVSFTTAPIIPGTISTVQPTSIGRTTAVSGGDITLDGGGEITQRGVCWSVLQNPEITDSLTTNGTGPGKFDSEISGLSPATRYFVRAYAINSAGIAYGDQFYFNTKMSDIQGNLYNTVTIGNQVWMSENLRATRYNNNTSIPNITTPSGWINLTGPGYCWYNNDITYKPTFGALYSWYTINTEKLCPTGWHVPSDSEFNLTEISLGMDPGLVDKWGWRGTDQGTQMKSTSGWDDNGNGSNSSGFNGLAGGYLQGSTGNSYAIGILTYWWTATDDAVNGNPDVAWYRRLDGVNNDVYKATTYKRGGKYVRCIKN